MIDTGSAVTVLSADLVAEVGITPAPHDPLYTVRGVGGVEVVFSRRVDGLQVGSCRLAQFCIEVGALDYGFDINGVLGMDFLMAANAVIDVGDQTLEFRPA